MIDEFKLCAEVGSIISSLAAEKKIKHLPRLIDEFIKFYNVENDIYHGIITSAKSLSEKEKNDIINDLMKRKIFSPQSKISFDVAVNSELIKGYRVSIGGYEIDNSYSSKLNTVINNQVERAISEIRLDISNFKLKFENAIKSAPLLKETEVIEITDVNDPQYKFYNQFTKITIK